jgi:cytochrome bd ubiquinol oxidase subunit I
VNVHGLIRRTRPLLGGLLVLVVLLSLVFTIHRASASGFRHTVQADVVGSSVSGTDVYYGTPGVPSSDAAPRASSGDYPSYRNINNRLAIWIITQQHTYFGGFVLALPIFCLIIEVMGLMAGNPTAAARYDRLARDFLRISLIAFAISSLLGSVLVGALLALYPSFFKYIATVFKSMMWIYALIFLAESTALYVYYYSWDRMATGARKWLHASVGVIVNVFGTVLLFLANSWVSFMMAPAGVDQFGRYLGNPWHTLHTALWNPFNAHRFLADMMTGGAVVLGYAAYRFLTAKSREEKAYYDWMGYTFMFLTMVALIPMPFAGYWLMRSVYVYRQQLGVTMMGGMLTWMFVLQAIAVGALFIGANYYVWQGLTRLPGSDRYYRYIKYLLYGLVLSFLVWFTPHTLFMTPEETKAMGGAQHPVIGNFGVMSAKNGAINLMIVLSGITYILYKRANKIITVKWAATGNMVISTVLAAAVLNIIGLAIYGFYLPANVRVGLSLPQFMTTITALTVVILLNRFMLRQARSVGPVTWGNVSIRGAVTLFLLGMAFTWVMGLMGFIRSSGRLSWHVHEILRDASAWSFTPSFTMAAAIVTINMMLFWLTLIGLFWLSRITLREADAPERTWAAAGEAAQATFASSLSNNSLLRDG